MELTQEEVIYKTRKKLGESFEVFGRTMHFCGCTAGIGWPCSSCGAKESHSLVRLHCETAMAVLEVQEPGNDRPNKTLLVCMKARCGHTEQVAHFN